MAALVYILIFSALTRYTSGAVYCLCKDGVGDQKLQSAIDYACGNGADCGPINQGGSCYSPNSVKDHCSYAANSYYQKKSQSQATCDFSGTATTSSTPPSGLPSTCVYPSSASGSTTPTTPTTGTLTPPTTTLTPPSTMLTPPSTSTGTTPIMTPPTTSTGGTTTGSNNPFSLGPTGFDNSAAKLVAKTSLLLVFSSMITIMMMVCF